MEDNKLSRIGKMLNGTVWQKTLAILCIILATALVLGIAVSLVLLAFPVAEIEVVGDSRYTYAELIEESGIKEGARLYFINENRAEKRLLERFPYLERVEIKSYFPNRVVIEISQFREIYLLLHESGFCYVNSEFEILEIVDTAPSADALNCICIKPEKAVSGQVGDTASGEDLDRAKELIGHLKTYGFYSYLSLVDVEDRFNLSFIISKKHKLIIGAMTDIKDKISACYQVCFSGSFKKDQSSIINATDKRNVFLRHVSEESILDELDFSKKQ